jgi:hypothetical protein
LTAFCDNSPGNLPKVDKFSVSSSSPPKSAYLLCFTGFSWLTAFCDNSPGKVDKVSSDFLRLSAL